MKSTLPSLLRTAALLFLAVCSPSKADVNDILFQVDISGARDRPKLVVSNLSPNVEITQFNMTIGDTLVGWNGHVRGTPVAPPGGTVEWVSPAPNTKVDNLTLKLTNFGPGESFSVDLELDTKTDPNLINVAGWWEVFFNNGNKPNSIVTVTSGARSESLTLKDGSLDYKFRGPGRRLDIRSRVESKQHLVVVNAKLNGLPFGPERFEEFGDNVSVGDKVEIQVPPVVYRDIHGVDISSIVSGNPALIKDKAEEKFTAIGISVNDVPQSGDPTLYRFEVTDNAEIEVKWDEAFALTVNHDFTKTRSSELLGDGSAWVGPLASDASGDPLPTANKHWIKRGDPAIGSIDGLSVDNSTHPGLDIRYAVKGYRAFGPPNHLVAVDSNLDRFLEKRGVDIRATEGSDVLGYAQDGTGTRVTTSQNHRLATGDKVTISGSSAGQNDGEYAVTVGGANTFTIAKTFTTVPQAKGKWLNTTYLKYIPFPGVEPRQQVLTNFTMSGPGGITWVWELQYGVRAAVDDQSRSGLAKIFKVDPNDATKLIDRTSVGGVAWFDPGDRIRVVAAAKELGTNGLSLTGWINGDGYYFAGLGEINTNNGALLKGQPVLINGKSPANWITPPATLTSANNLGFEIPALQRPARVLWRYGTGAISLNVTIGKHLFEERPGLAAMFTRDPMPIKDTVPSSSLALPQGASIDTLITEWDPVARQLYPTLPGTFTVPWKPGSTGDGVVDIRVTAVLPQDTVRGITGHYPHVVEGPPVALDPDANDDLVFKSLKFSTSDAAVDGKKLFTTAKAGMAVLLFTQVQRVGRGQPREFLRVRVVDSRTWKNAHKAAGSATVGTTIRDSAADGANLGTGYLYNPSGKARFNPNVYSYEKMTNGLAAKDIYDMNLLRSDQSALRVLNKLALPGPVIPVNSQPSPAEEELPIIFWYDDPRKNDTILWTYKARVYTPAWPDANTFASLPRIVIASQLGSEGKSASDTNQQVAPAIGDYAAATTFDPTRFQAVQIYQQPDRLQPGYNPNEEHALMAPSFRFREISPRPNAAYALRAGDLNTSNESTPATYTSRPCVLVQYFDKADQESKMKLYTITAETSGTDKPSYKFADLSGNLSASSLNAQRPNFVTMKAGEPVIPFYPLGVAIGASPCKNTFGRDLLGQNSYWKDYKTTSWAIAGGENAWFSVSFFYPLDPAFYWPAGLKVPMRVTSEDNVLKVFSGPNETTLELFPNAAYTYDKWVEPQVGDCVAFLPLSVSAKGDTAGNVTTSHLPKPILYKADWPDNPAILKAGETLTFSGGENRADNPNLVIVRNGVTETMETPGLPQLTAFSSAEIVFDSVNPLKEVSKMANGWTARVVQALDKRSVDYPNTEFPSELRPAGGRVRVTAGKYIFNDLPASLQRRLRYDPITGKLEFSGLLNDKPIGDATLTAAPSAVYVLEPNIITEDERDQIKAIVKTDGAKWSEKIDALFTLTRDPEVLGLANIHPATVLQPFNAGLMHNLELDAQGAVVRDNEGNPKIQPSKPIVQQRAYGPGLALIPNGDFLDPNNTTLPVESWVTVVENNDPRFNGSPVTPHIIKVDRRKRYRGAIKTILSDNVFDENIILRSTGDFGANAGRLKFEWYYRPDDGSLNVPPPDLLRAGQPNPWKLFPDPTGKNGLGRYQITLKGNPNAPEALLADTFWFCRYRHVNDLPASGSNWAPNTTSPSGTIKYTWAGAGNSDPFHDFDLDGLKDYRAQLASGWIKRVLDAVNPYEARIRNFEGDNPATVTSMLQQLGPRFEGPVALNPSKNVIENVGLIELYETVLNRGRNLSIDLSQPVSTPAISNALQLASTRLADFYTLLGNEAYGDATDPTIGISLVDGGSSVDNGNVATAVHAFKNQTSNMLEEELGLLHGVDDYFARPVYNRMFWNFTKGEGEAAYASNYNISDINQDGFINEADAMKLYPQGHGDAWGHYLTALTGQYELLRHKNFNWVSRSEFYNLQDIVMKVDFMDERKFAATAAAKAKAGAEIVSLTYRDKYVADPNAQWQGYTDTNKDRAWGVEEWARRAGQGAYFDWVTANALLPSEHPNKTLEGVQKVDRTTNADIAVISANLNAVQGTIDSANRGENPLGVARGAQIFDIDPTFLEVGSTAQIGTRAVQGLLHFDQIFERAIKMMENVAFTWDNANLNRNRLRQLATTEAEFRNATFQEDLDYRNRLIAIFGKPYDGTIGPGRLYPAGYEGPDLGLYMYVPIREITKATVPGPAKSFAEFTSPNGLSGGDLFTAAREGNGSTGGIAGSSASLSDVSDKIKQLFTVTFAQATNYLTYDDKTTAGLFAVNYTDLDNRKVDLDGMVGQMPITAKGFTFQAPVAWGSRRSNGELQQLITQMMQQEAAVAEAIGAWDSLSGEIVRILRLMNARISTSGRILRRDQIFSRVKVITNQAITVLESIVEGINLAENTIYLASDTMKDAVPLVLPTGGLAVSPGDALSMLRAGASIQKTTAYAVMGSLEKFTKISKLIATVALEIAENEVRLLNAGEERDLQIKEWLKELEDKAGDEPIRRITIFKEMQALRELSDAYRAKLDEGGRLLDERTAYNKRVAAQTQSNRYQDMTFRVAKNFAMQTYRNSFDLAAKYTYLAAAAYDYETNYALTDPGSAQTAFREIVAARSLGLFVDGQPRQGGGGLCEAIAKLKANYESQKGQLGFNNVQRETGQISMRTELFRILPAGSTQPNNFPSPGQTSDDEWKRTLQKSRVDDLWEVPEYRYFCRPFQAERDNAGVRVKQPAIIIKFGSEITAGKNFFGKPLAGGDHAYNSSDFATKIVGAGVWLSDYKSDDVQNGLSNAPRLYLVPLGLDVMRVPHSLNPDETRTWNVVDQAIPVPIPALASNLAKSGYIPLLDSLNGKYGEQRRFPSFRAYHDGTGEIGDLVNDARLVGRSIWNTEWMLIIPGRTLNADPAVGLDRFVDQVSDINLIFDSYGQSGG